MNKPTGWYVINDVDEIDSPSLVVYPERVMLNIALVIKMAGDVSRLRPHIKTHKCKEAVLLQIDAGISKFKCATIAEAELLGICKAFDVLFAYQPIGIKIKRLITLINNYPETKFSCLIDNLSTAELISAEAMANDLQIPVYIDLNVGMDRTGIVPAKALNLYLNANLLTGIKPVGLHAYDGHIHDTDLNVRSIKAESIYGQLQDLKSAIVGAGLPQPILVAGGTPTFPYYAKQHDVVCSPGTFIYWDAGYSHNFKEQEFLPAALIITRVVSLPSDKKVCLDLGHKSVAAESSIDKRVLFLNGHNLVIISQSEEHLVVQAGAEHGYKPGDVLYAMPYHICPTVALYDKAITIENNKVTGEWLTPARNRKITV